MFIISQIGNLFYQQQQQQHHHQQQMQQMDTGMSHFNNANRNHIAKKQLNMSCNQYCACLQPQSHPHAKLSQINTNSKVTKQKKEDRLNKKRISNIINKVSSLQQQNINFNQHQHQQQQYLANINEHHQKPSFVHLMPSQAIKSTPSRLEKAKELARKHQHSDVNDCHKFDRSLNSSACSSTSSSTSSPLYLPQSPVFNNSYSNTPLSNLSLSPSSSSLSSSSSTHSTASSSSSSSLFYPVDLISNLLPFYLTPYLNRGQTTAAPSNVNAFPHLIAPQPQADQLYLQNLISTMYAFTNYQQQQQQQQTNPNQYETSPNANLNNFLLYSLANNQNRLNAYNSANNTTNNNEPQLDNNKNKLDKNNNEVLYDEQSRLIGVSNKEDVDSKVDEHFKRSLGAKYLKYIKKQNSGENSSDAFKKQKSENDLSDAASSCCAECDMNKSKSDSNDLNYSNKLNESGDLNNKISYDGEEETCDCSCRSNEEALTEFNDDTESLINFDEENKTKTNKNEECNESHEYEEENQHFIHSPSPCSSLTSLSSVNHSLNSSMSSPFKANKIKKSKSNPENVVLEVVDTHFSKALGEETWNKLKTCSPLSASSPLPSSMLSSLSTSNSLIINEDTSSTSSIQSVSSSSLSPIKN